MDARKIIALSASVLMLSACGTSNPPPEVQQPRRNLQDVASAIIIQRDEYNKTINYIGPNAAEKHPDKMYMRAWKKDHGDTTYQIYVMINYSGNWRLYNWAYDPNGSTLDTTLITRKLAQCQRTDCAHIEDIGVDVTRKYLEENQRTGIRFWVSGKSGEDETFFVPPNYVRAFLSVVK